jgi:hypothetical protein
VVALAPDHTGATLAPRPSLFWYVSGPIPAEAGWVFALVDPTRIEPALEVPLTSPAGAGIQRIDLEQLGGPSFGLEPGVEYEWSVALVFDENERARDVVSLGWIDRIARPSGLAERAGAVELARHGLWYDALAALEDALAASPGDPQLRAERAALLDQGGLGLDPPGARK